MFSLRNGAGHTIVGFGEVLVVAFLGGLSFALAWVLIRGSGLRGPKA